MGPSDDYYAILNVPLTASEEEIKQAFRRLSIMYHPDKHIDPTKKQAAESIFQKINTAHSVLSSVTMRALYDELGEEGVKASWQIGAYTGNSNERQKILEAIKENKGLRMQRFKSSSLISTGLDASTWIDDYSPFGPLEWYDYIPSLGQMDVTQNFETWLAPETSASLACSMMTQNGQGSGSVTTAIHHQLNHETMTDVSLTLGNQRSISIGARHLYNRHKMLLIGNIMGLLHSGILFPIIQTGIGRQFFGIQTVTTISFGAQNSFNLDAQWPESLGLGASSLNLKISRFQSRLKYRQDIFLKKDLTLGFRITINALSNSSKLSFGLKKAWSPLYSTGSFIQFDGSDGIILKLSIARENDYKFVLPLKLSYELTPTSMLLGSTIPAVLGFMLNRFIIGPIQRFLDEKERSIEAEELAKERERLALEAALVADILVPAYQKRVEAELKNDGLIITKATYTSSLESLDVTIPLQVLVVDGQLLLEGGKSKSGILGFFDIDPGQSKKLTIEYTFRGRKHLVSLDDSNRVMLPQRHHQLL